MNKLHQDFFSSGDSLTVRGIHDRLRQIAGNHTCSAIARATGFHREAVRRYLGGAEPPLQFVCALGSALGVDLRWLLTGEGSMNPEENVRAMIRDADISTVLRGVADRFELLTERLEDLESLTRQLADSIQRLEESEPAPRHIPIARITSATPSNAAAAGE